jgi:hypothetical protein
LIEIICYTVCTTWLRLFLHEPNKNCDQSLKMFCWSFFVLLSFFDLRILIAPLVSSNFYCRSLFVVLSFSFSFGHCIVCRPNYGFWLPIWHLHAFFLQDRRYIIYSVHNYTNCITLIVLQCLSSSLSYIYGVGNILAYNQDVDIWFSVHDIFPEQPSSGTHIVKRLESQMI